MPSAEEITQIYNIETKVAGLTGIIGSGFILHQFFKDPKNKKDFNKRLVFWMALMELVTGIAFFFGPMAFTNHTFCTLQGILVQWSSSGPCWNGVQALNVLIRVVFNVHSEKIELKYEKYYHVFAWGVPAIGVIMGIAQDMFAPSGAWCWIKASLPLYRIVLYYGIVWTVMLFSLVSSSYVVYFVQRRLKTSILRRNLPSSFIKSSNAKSSGTEQKMVPEPAKNVTKLKKMTVKTYKQLLYVLVFLIVQIPGSTNRMIQMVHGSSPFFLSALHSFLLPAQGFFNGLVYVGIHFYEDNNKTPK